MAPKTMKSRAKPASRLRSAQVVARRASPKAARPLPVTKTAKAPFRGKPLGRREVSELRKMLEQEQDRLMAELEAMEEHAPEVEEQVGMDIGGGDDEDLADGASSTVEGGKSVALEARGRQTLAQVEEALQRIENGTDG